MNNRSKKLTALTNHNHKNTKLDQGDECSVQLHESQEFLQLQINRMPIGCIIWSDLLQVISWNPAAERIFSLSSAEAFNKHPFEIVFSKESWQRVEKKWRDVFKGDSTINMISENLTKDKKNIICEWTNTPLRNSNGVIVGLLSMVQDITERKRAETYIKKLIDLRGKFIEIISHQLRTPLTSVNWNLEMLLAGDFGSMDENQRKFLQITHDASVKITHRIHNLLEAMDIEEGRVHYKKEDVAINSIFVSIMNETKKRCELKSLAFSYACPEINTPITVAGDDEKIRAIFNKLMENALGYTKENGKITATLSIKGDMVRFEVQDTGVGIPESEQNNIFTRFFRASNAPSMQTDAFGLGLFIAKYFVEHHKGKIGFDSKENKGSKFWFELPLKIEI